MAADRQPAAHSQRLQRTGIVLARPRVAFLGPYPVLYQAVENTDHWSPH